MNYYTPEHRADPQFPHEHFFILNNMYSVAGGTLVGNITGVSILSTVSRIHPRSSGSNGGVLDSSACIHSAMPYSIYTDITYAYQPILL